MFTGLVKCLGAVVAVRKFGQGVRFTIALGEIRPNVAVGQSIAVNGVCLTATALGSDTADFDAVAETVSRTNLGALRPNDRVNLEPALLAGDALDGHFVLGHVDAVARVVAVDDQSADNRRIEIELPAALRHLVAEKGSIAIDGLSLTVAGASDQTFSVAIIPHTWGNTTLGGKKPGDLVNLEADVLARYAARILRFGASAAASASSSISEDFLRDNGFA